MTTLSAAVEAGTRAARGPDRELDAILLCGLLAPTGSKVEQSRLNGNWCIYEPAAHKSPPFRLWEQIPQRFWSDHAHPTASLEAAIALVTFVLPGWWWSCGLCDLTGHASIGPDYNGPHRDRLITEWPPEIYDHGNFNADLAPGDGIHRVCYALLDCMVQALEAIGDPRVAALRLKIEEMGR